jgi:alanine racemase
MKKRSRPSDPLRHRVVARLSASALRGNYRAISRLAPGQRIIPMIKAGAYGHGAVWAAQVLASSPGLYGFGVATLEEGIELRKQARIPSRIPILIFSGITPYTEGRGALCSKLGLVPVFSSIEDWKAFSRGRFFGKLPYELKFNSGMNRLGLPVAMASELARLFAKDPALAPRGVLSHLATAEKPEGQLARLQLERFVAVRRELSGVLEGRATFHLANSSAIWKASEWRLGELTGAVRPGISLYGVPPWAGAEAQGIRQVMSLEACVIGVRKLTAEDLVGYGGTYRGEGDDPSVAVLSAGYADGIHRALSNRGRATVAGQPARFAGIISMDLSALELPPGVRPRVGSYARVLGPGIEPWAQAALAGTVPYELLTSVPSSPRVHKIHGS